MSSEKVIIDADPGIGDAVAIALALSDPELNVIGLTACGGQVDGEQAFRNLQTIVSIIEPRRWPRLGWSQSPRAFMPSELQQFGILHDAHSHRLGDCEPIEASLQKPHESAKVMVDLVRDHPRDVSVVTMGPLTNVQRAMELWPEFADNVKQLICLGGAVSATGDVTAVAEFNIFSDPEAARFVFHSPIDITLVPIEIAQKAILTFDQYDSLRVDAFSRLGMFLSQTLPFALRESRTQLGLEGIELRELVALTALSHPRMFARHALPVEIELHGEITRGMTVFDQRGCDTSDMSLDVLTNVNTEGVFDYAMRLIQSSSVS